MDQSQLFHCRSSNYKTWHKRVCIWSGVFLAVTSAIALSRLRLQPVPLSSGLALWFAEILFIAIFSSHWVGAGVGVIIAAAMLPMPAILDCGPLMQMLLACCMCATFVRAADLTGLNREDNFTARLASLFAFPGVRSLATCPACSTRFNSPALSHMLIAALILTAMIATVDAIPATGAWLILRWLAGGLGLLAVAEISTACHNLISPVLFRTSQPLFNSPYRSISISDFWNCRWNLAASDALRRYCFKPLARRMGPTLAMVATFLLSAIGHALLILLSLKNVQLALICGAFFLIQPLFILVEKEWRIPCRSILIARTWTLGVLAVTSPLIVEPVLQICEADWFSPHNVLGASAVVTLVVITVSSVISLASVIVLRTSLQKKYLESNYAEAGSCS